MASPYRTPFSLKPSVSGLQVAIHPLRPVVGALLGTQDGRDVKITTAFDCRVEENHIHEYTIDEDWFETRLAQYKEVSGDMPIDLVGWYTATCELFGVGNEMLKIHNQFLAFNENVLYLSFNDWELKVAALDTLPIALYESVDEPICDNDLELLDGIARPGSSKLRLRKLPYTIETGEAEMIALNTIAAGGKSAAAIQAESENGDLESMYRAMQKRQQPPLLTPEEEDRIKSLESHLDAIKMLDSRLAVIKDFLDKAISDPEYLNSFRNDVDTNPHCRLREISSLLSRLSLLNPRGDENALLTEFKTQSNNVAVVEILGSLCQGISEMREISKAFVLNEAKAQANGLGPLGHTMQSLGEIPGPSKGKERLLFRSTESSM
ncbi:hypothetical protein KEM55_004150 [Ascosphaera atra]|nr:hypothetical protein KEM55_004150 [Ascosphaera atra]